MGPEVDRSEGECRSFPAPNDSRKSDTNHHDLYTLHLYISHHPATAFKQTAWLHFRGEACRIDCIYTGVFLLGYLIWRHRMSNWSGRSGGQVILGGEEVQLGFMFSRINIHIPQSCPGGLYPLSHRSVVEQDIIYRITCTLRTLAPQCRPTNA